MGTQSPPPLSQTTGSAFSKVVEKAAVAACTDEQGYGACRIWAMTAHKCQLHNAQGVGTSHIQTEGHTNAGFTLLPSLMLCF